jgi:hypothetical protein
MKLNQFIDFMIEIRDKDAAYGDFEVYHGQENGQEVNVINVLSVSINEDADAFILRGLTKPQLKVIK